MKPLKILFISRKYPPSVGGMERFAYDLSSSLASLPEIKIIKKLTWGGSNYWLPLILPMHLLRGFLYLLFHPVDIIHAQDGIESVVAGLLAKVFRKPYIVVAHGLDVTHPSVIYQKTVIPFMRSADHVISISSATEQEIVGRGLEVDRSSVITLGAHDDFEGYVRPDRKGLNKLLGLKSDDKSPILLTTGRLVRRKGVEWFIKNVLPKLASSYPHIKYIVVGDGSEKPAIEESIVDNGLSNNVYMMGRVNDEQRSLLYQSVDIFVMPNIVVSGDMEGFGIVAHEAAIAQLPVVASGIEGIKDAIKDGKNGWLLPSGDVKAFEETISKLVDSPQARRKLGKKARIYTLEEYGWIKIARRYQAIYRAVLDRRKK